MQFRIWGFVFDLGLGVGFRVSCFREMRDSAAGAAVGLGNLNAYRNDTVGTPTQFRVHNGRILHTSFHKIGYHRSKY